MSIDPSEFEPGVMGVDLPVNEPVWNTMRRLMTAYVEMKDASSLKVARAVDPSSGPQMVIIVDGASFPLDLHVAEAFAGILIGMGETAKQERLVSHGARLLRYVEHARAENRKKAS